MRTIHTETRSSIYLKRNTLNNLFDYAVKEHNSIPALTFIGEKGYSYNDLKTEVQKAQILMEKQGINRGDKVSLLSENRPEWGIWYLAITTMGAVVVPILPDFHRDEVKQILIHSESSLLITSDKYDKDYGTGIKSLNISCLHKQIDGDNTSAYFFNVEEEDLAAIIYTSGTTGQSKGVMLSHNNIVSNVLASYSIPVYLKKGDSFLSILPMSHTYECTLGFLVPLVLGGCTHYLKKAPSPSILAKALKEVRPHAMLTVPIFIEKIYKSKIEPQLNRGIARILKVIPLINTIVYRKAGKALLESIGNRMVFFGIGGAPLNPQVEKFLRRARFPYAPGYGLTETSPLIAGADFTVSRYRSVGPAIQGLQVKLSPENGTKKEICVKGPTVMMGYYKDKERTDEVIDADGWFHTGDLGEIDSNGYIAVNGRLKTMILSASGENIYPETIEAVVNRFPFVQDSLVVNRNGNLVARVQLDREALKEHLSSLNNKARTHVENLKDEIDRIMESIRKEANQKLNRFSRLGMVIEQEEPFKKTPTLKIKRYLYS